MKKTLKCAAAAISALAVVTASSLSASAASCLWVVGSPNNCGSAPNTSNCGTNVYSFCPDYSDLFSLLRSLSSGNLFGNSNSCNGSNDSTCNTPGCETAPGTGADDSTCDTPDCAAPGSSDNTADNAPSAPDVSKPGTSTDSVSAYEKKVVELVNAQRARYGLSALTLNTELSAIARAKSQDMRDKNYFSHTSPTYGSPFDMMKSFGIRYNTAGENIAYGYKTPEAVVNGWMNSAGHRANILNASYKEIGVGYVADGNYWTQMFIG